MQRESAVLWSAAAAAEVVKSSQKDVVLLLKIQNHLWMPCECSHGKCAGCKLSRHLVMTSYQGGIND